MKCYICNGEFKKPQYGRNFLLEILLFIFTLPLLLIPLFIYYLATPRWKCPHCGNKVNYSKFNY